MTSTLTPAPPPTPHLPTPWPGTVLGTLLILKPYLQIRLFISPRSFVTLIKKGGLEGREGENVASLND